MKKLLITSCLASLSAVSLAAPAQAPANPFNYNFIEGQYVDISNDNLDNDNNPYHDDADVDGFRIRGSFDVAQAFSLVGSVLDASGNHYDLTVFTIGGAYHQALPKIDTMPFDLVVRAEIEHVETDFDNRNDHWDDSETGILLSGGVQLAIVDKLQAFSELAISSNDYRDVSLLAGARYEFVPNLEAIAAVEVGDIDIFSTGLRYNF